MTDDACSGLAAVVVVTVAAAGGVKLSRLQGAGRGVGDLHGDAGEVADRRC